ncbi:MAG: hypothetical protein K2H04_00555 [Bacteroidaceae bacterium]|nr:hypothetical protein [Bacteroidaceae bacterium]
MKKKIFKAFFAVAAIATVGLGSYKAYGSYMATNMSENDLLLQENVLALSDDNNAKSYCSGSSIWGWVESSDGQYDTRIHICDSFDYQCTEVYVRCWASGTGTLDGISGGNQVIPISKSNGTYVKCTNDHKSLSDLYRL